MKKRKKNLKEQKHYKYTSDHRVAGLDRNRRRNYKPAFFSVVMSQFFLSKSNPMINQFLFGHASDKEGVWGFGPLGGNVGTLGSV